MMSGQANQVIRRVRAALVQAAAEPGDAQLLDAYLARRDELAFAALVRRHGPMVLGVCRRLLANAHDAEDAFQATFLVLVRKAASVRPRERVGNWLYGVAYRTALEARGAAARRRAKERHMPTPDLAEAAGEDDVWQDVRPLLDRELNALPEPYRIAVVLCDLEGKTRKQAAQQLGWPEGTVAGRLARARALLARRLSKHGVVLSAASLPVLLPHHASAGVPASLAHATARIASLFASWQAASGIPAKVAALSEGVMKAMLFAKLRATLAVAMLVGFLGLIGGLGAYRTLAGDAQGGEGGQPPAPAQKVAPPTTSAQPGKPPLDDAGHELAALGRLPDGQPPVQALVSLAKDGGLVVRTGTSFWEPVTSRRADGVLVTTYRQVSQVRTEHFKSGEFKVRDTQGKPVSVQQLPNRLKGGTVALIHWGDAELDPRHLVLIKDGTLVFALPPRTTPLPAAIAEVPPLAPLPELPRTAPGTQPPPTEEAVPPAELPRSAPPADMGFPVLPEHIAINTRKFQIALDVHHKDIQLATAIHLLMSRDQGSHWEEIARFLPGTKALTYQAPADGTYWFAAEFVSASGTTRRLPPHLKVMVQTAQPSRTQAASLPALKVEGHDDYVTINVRKFDIPLAVNQAQRQSIAKLRLWVSTDKGKNWTPAAQVTPDVASFAYDATRDGPHWFAIQVVSKDGMPDPADLGKFLPQLKVFVQAVTAP